ncbi:MAG TPA: hypothetical protein VFK76_12330 [Gaiellaceae bacterium]|nr:hypothetical protein [Gaiellaceae bacterium]
MSDFEEQPGIGIPGVTGAAAGRTWDALASAHAPDLTGDSVSFVALEDGSLIVEEDVPDGSLSPLADALEEHVSPPYRATAVRDEGDIWSVSAQRVSVSELPGIDGDVVELSVVGGNREVSIDGQPASEWVSALDALVEGPGDTVVRAERVDGDLFTIDVFAL